MEPLALWSLDMAPLVIAPPELDCAKAGPAANRANTAIIANFFISLSSNDRAQAALTFHMEQVWRMPHRLLAARRRDNSAAATFLHQHRFAQSGLGGRGRGIACGRTGPGTQFHQLFDNIAVRQGDAAILAAGDGNI